MAISDDFKTQLRKKAEYVNGLLERVLAAQNEIEPSLKKALKYILQGKGKRIRGVLVLWCCELIGGRINRDAQAAAAAIEMVHTYSLVHDDLPAMDDDDLRRGRPTCHKAFDEATAILAGDGLLTLAFEIVAKKTSEPAVAVKLISQLAQAAGPAGMIAGQMADLKAENIKGNKKLLEYIHINKTAKMFRVAALMGAIAGGARAKELKLLGEYGLKIGLGFQIADDILDVSASSEQLGKTAGKDIKAGKMTYPSLMGMDKSKALAAKIADEAIAALKPFGEKADMLRKLTTSLLEREK